MKHLIKKKQDSYETDYGTYRLSAGEMTAGVLLYAAVSAGVSLLFYDSLIPCAFMSPGAVVFLKVFAAKRCRERQRRLLMEFRELLLALSANMSAGYSLESAFAPVYRELDGVYKGLGNMQREVVIIMRGLEMGEDVISLLRDLADRSGVEEIEQFAQVIAVAQRSGGNVIHMMKSMAENIKQKLEVEAEIDTLITAKQFEQNIMSVMPFGIVLYLRVFNKGYMDALYGSAFGAAVMSLCLLLTVFMSYWGRKISDIRV